MNIFDEHNKGIELSNAQEAVFLCTWDGDMIVEIHTAKTLYQKYKDTNLYTEDFTEMFEMPIEFYLSRFGNGDYQIFDNMRVERIL